MRERIDHLIQRERAIVVATHCSRHYGPQRTVRVLRAIFAHTGQITLDVPRVVRAFIERRREQHDEPRIFTHQLSVHRAHRLLLTALQCCAGNHAPTLRDGINATFIA